MLKMSKALRYRLVDWSKGLKNPVAQHHKIQKCVGRRHESDEQRPKLSWQRTRRAALWS